MLAVAGGDWKTAAATLNAIAEKSPGVLARAMEDWPQNLQASVDSRPNGAAAAFLVCVRDRSTPCDLASVGGGRHAASVSPEALYQQQRWERLIALPVLPNQEAIAWFWRGAALAHLGRWESAIPALEHSLSDKDDNVYARFLLCRSYARAAGKVVALLEQQQGDEATVHLIKGDVLLRMQANSAGAIAEYTMALRTHGGDPKLLERLAEALFENGQPKEAVESAKAALSIDPYRFAAMQTLARVAIEQRRYEEALPYLTQLTTHNPKDVAAQVELGTALGETGDANEGDQAPCAAA